MKRSILAIAAFVFVTSFAFAQEPTYTFTESELEQVLNDHGQAIADEVTARLTRDHLQEIADKDLEIANVQADVRFWRNQAQYWQSEADRLKWQWGGVGLGIGIVVGVTGALILGLTL